VREAIFSTLGSEGRIESAKVLDVFSGAGTLGIEALSRGASYAVFIEKNRELARDLGVNINALNLSNCSTVIDEDVNKVPPEDLLKIVGGSFDMVFIDPPYKMTDGEVEKIVLNLDLPQILAATGLIIIGRDKRSKLDASRMGDLAEKSLKVYGDSAISYYSLAQKE
jgi:16S rRNA (guanine966-N2)-methyltransferase